jgi:molybdopterin-biosynthesis enzyme MoeA-like protein
MGFSNDPEMGPTSDRFTGSAVATLVTQPFVRTAALR